MDNAVNGAENMVEDAGKGISAGLGQGMNTVQDMGQGMVNGMSSAFMGMTGDNNNNGENNNNNGDYTAQRTATTINPVTNFFGNNSALLAWLTLIIVGAVIVGLVWYYGQEHEYSTNHNEDNY